MKVLVYGNIGEKVDGDAISQQLRDMAIQSNSIDVHINSYGGDVQQGISIFSTIVSLNNEGKEVNTFIDGFAASVASIIAIAGKNIYMNDFARIMVHEAFKGDGSNLSENDKKALDEINDMLAQILSRRGVEKNSIIAKMKDETWINAEDAQELGLVDEIMETKATVKQRAEVIMSSQTMEASKRLSYINNLLGEQAVTTVKPKKTDEMDRLKAKLDLNSEDKIINKFDELQSENTKLKDEKSALEKEKEQLKKEKAEQTKAEVTALIDTAIENGTLSKEKRDELIKEAEKAPESIKAMINAMPKPSGEKLSDKFKAQAGPTRTGGENEENLAVEYDRMAREEPDALQDLEKVDQAKFKAMYNAWLKHDVEQIKAKK